MRAKRLKIIIAVLLTAFISYGLIGRFSFQKRHSFTPLKRYSNSTLRVGIIGDSWVAGNKLDSGIFNEFARHNIKIEVISSGQSGAKTNEIYNNLFKDSLERFSSNRILQHNLDYCIVLGGVNDAITQMGPNYYSHHISLILQDLLKQGIKPVLLTLPRFEIKRNYEAMNILKRVQFKTSSYFTTGGVVNDIDMYRNNLDNSLKQSKLIDSVILIHADSICTDYSKHKNLYLNYVHLSPVGNQFLSHYIADVILQKIELNKKQQIAFNH
jgi:hypothetical protein